MYRHPYVANDKKETLNGGLSNWRDFNEEDDLRRYDPIKGVAGFRRFWSFACESFKSNYCQD